MKIAVIGTAIWADSTTEGQTFKGWHGSMLGVLAGLSCVLDPDDIVYPIAQVGDADAETFVKYVKETWGDIFDFSYMVWDPDGTNVHKGIHTEEGEQVWTAREVEPVRYDDVKPLFEDGVDAVILNCGDVDAWDDEIVRQIRTYHPFTFIHVDVHRKVNRRREDGLLESPGWSGWKKHLGYAHAVQMCWHECQSLLQIKADSTFAAHQASKTIMREGISCLILTLGAEGSLLSEPYYESPVQIPATDCVFSDPLGAGDSFGAGFVVSKVRGLLSLHAAQFGSTLAAICCESLGFLMPQTTTYEKIQARMEQNYAG